MLRSRSPCSVSRLGRLRRVVCVSRLHGGRWRSLRKREESGRSLVRRLRRSLLAERLHARRASPGSARSRERARDRACRTPRGPGQSSSIPRSPTTPYVPLLGGRTARGTGAAGTPAQCGTARRRPAPGPPLASPPRGAPHETPDRLERPQIHPVRLIQHLDIFRSCSSSRARSFSNSS